MSNDRLPRTARLGLLFVFIFSTPLKKMVILNKMLEENYLKNQILCADVKNKIQRVTTP